MAEAVGWPSGLREYRSDRTVGVDVVVNPVLAVLGSVHANFYW